MTRDDVTRDDVAHDDVAHDDVGHDDVAGEPRTTDAGADAHEPDAGDRAVLDRVTQVAAARLLSASGHARAYRVTDAAGNDFVVKLVHPVTVRRAVALATSLAATPGVNPVLASEAFESIGYVVHPWHAGDLAALLARRPLDPAEATRVLRPVAHTLAELHRLGFVHADLKPQNVLVTSDGEGLLGDLDEAVPAGTVLTRWTPGWAAPEVRRDVPVTPATDHYGFALTTAAALLGTSTALAPGQPWAAVLPVPLATSVAASLDDDPAARRVGPVALVVQLQGAGLMPGAPRGLPLPPAGTALPVAVAVGAEPVAPPTGLAPEPAREPEDDPDAVVEPGPVAAVVEPGPVAADVEPGPVADVVEPGPVAAVGPEPEPDIEPQQPDPEPGGPGADLRELAPGAAERLAALLAEAADPTVDLTAPTVDRPGLVARPYALPLSAPARSAWSLPLLTALVLAVLLTGAGVVWAVLGT